MNYNNVAKRVKLGHFFGLEKKDLYNYLTSTSSNCLKFHQQLFQLFVDRISNFFERKWDKLLLDKCMEKSPFPNSFIKIMDRHTYLIKSYHFFFTYLILSDHREPGRFSRFLFMGDSWEKLRNSPGFMFLVIGKVVSRGDIFQVTKSFLVDHLSSQTF